MVNQVYAIETTFKINYSTKDPVPIPDIIRSLESTEKLLKRTKSFVEKAYEGVHITIVEVYVDDIHSGSLKENYVVRFILGEDNTAKLDELVDSIMADNKALAAVVALGIAGYAGYGIGSIATGPSINIQAHEQSTINFGSTIGLSGDDIANILDRTTDKKALAKEAVGFIAPAHQDGQAIIEMGGITELTINRDFIDESPVEYIPPTPTEKDDHYTNVEVITSSGANDKRDSIWSGSVPGVVDKNIKFTLGEDVDPKKLYGRVKFKADIEVTSHFIKSKNTYEPKQVYIKTVY